MPNTEVSADSADDCDVLYEKIIGSHHYTADYDTEECSANKNCSAQAVEYHQCKCQLIESEYPNYAAEELALFLKLESDSAKYSADVKVKTLPEETIDLGIGKLGDDNLMKSDTENDLDLTKCEVVWRSGENSLDPEDDSDSRDCEILWAKSTNSVAPCADQPAKELIIKSASQPPQTSPKIERSIKDPEEELKYDSVPLATRIYGLSTNLKKTERKPNGVTKNNSNKTSHRRCDVCKCSVASMYDLRLHLLGHIDDTKHNAEIYNNSIVALQKLKPSVKIDGIRKHMCTLCAKSFPKRKQLWDHKMTTHSEGRPWRCQYCAKNYTRSTHLRRHELTHAE